MNWSATHAVEMGDDVVLLMHHEGSMYQESEWDNYLPSDFSLDQGKVFFLGQPFKGRVLNWVGDEWRIGS